MKQIKIKSGLGAEEILINDNPIQNDWDLYCAVSGTKNSIMDAIGTVYYYRDTKQKRINVEKAIDGIIDNLAKLITDYYHTKAPEEAYATRTEPQ